MRKVTFGCANSLDNFTARRDYGVDWLLWSDEVAGIASDYWKTIDTVVMGRKSYQGASGSAGHTGYPGVKTYVLSRTLESKAGAAVSIVRQDAVEFVRTLKGQGGKGICIMSGGDLARPLFEAGLIDEVGVNIHPVLLGNGIPLFHTMTRPIDLELKDCRRLKNGCVYLLYRVKSAQ